MKTAMWATMIFILGILGVVLINIFGNITTTNQQDYTLLKNTVEASMYDARDIASYKAGFYVCSNEEKASSGKSEFVFSDKAKYNVIVKVNNSNYQEEIAKYKNCEELEGEYKLNTEVFVESFTRRFAESINNNKSYQITIQEVIEYPPMVSVRVDTFDTYNSSEGRDNDFNVGEFTIRNEVNAIFENNKDVIFK